MVCVDVVAWRRLLMSDAATSAVTLRSPSHPFAPPPPRHKKTAANFGFVALFAEVRTGATGLEPAAYGVTERRCGGPLWLCRAESVRKRHLWITLIWQPAFRGAESLGSRIHDAGSTGEVGRALGDRARVSLILRRSRL